MMEPASHSKAGDDASELLAENVSEENLMAERLSEARAELRKLKAWLINDALPFWADSGFDRSASLFHERLDWAGRPLSDAPRRLMVQCRQIYVFAHATLIGWFDGRELVRTILSSLLLTYGNRVSGVPYVFSIARDGDVVDPRQDAYSYAFLLFALAWARRLLGDEVGAETSEKLMRHFDRVLAHPSGEGFQSESPQRDRLLRQNHHMHLFEAALEVEDAFGSPYASGLADRLFRLFRDRLFLHSAKALPEIHDDSWSLAETPEPMFEPGHHFEWIWLLDRYAARRSEDVGRLIGLLAERSYGEGVDLAGAAIETVGVYSGWRVESRRCWGSCEGLKAAISDLAAGRDRAAALERAKNFMRVLRTIFLSGPFGGGFFDRVGVDDVPLVDFVPASGLYHIMSATAEADRVLGARAPLDGTV
jgi:mannose-6-phosphate isomerase